MSRPRWAWPVAVDPGSPGWGAAIRRLSLCLPRAAALFRSAVASTDWHARDRRPILYMVTITKYSSAMSSPTDSPPPSTGYLLWHLSLRWRVALDRALAPLGLTSSQYGVLASLHGFCRAGSRPSQRELASFSGLEPMHVSKLIRALERAGLVERAGNPAAR